MAEEEIIEAEPSGGMGILGFVAGKLTDAFFAVGDFLTSDRALGGFFRQGLDELGTAFGQMVPDSIQVDESGTLWNPTQGEIAAGSQDHRAFVGYDGPSPSELAASNEPYLQQDQGHDLGDDMSY